MRWNFFSGAFPLDPAEVARQLHSRWLSRAITSKKAYPRIPVRPVSEGGFSGLTQTEEGRAANDAWWEATLEMVDDAGPDAGSDTDQATDQVTDQGSDDNSNTETGDDDTDPS